MSAKGVILTHDDDGLTAAVPSKVELDRSGPFCGGLEVPESDGGRANSARGCNIYGSTLVWLLFLAAVSTQFALLIDIYASVNVSGEYDVYTAHCEEGNDVPYFGRKLDSGVAQELCECYAHHNNETGRRVLHSHDDYKNMFDLLTDHIYIPITAAVAVAVVAILWLELLKRFGTTVVTMSLVTVFGMGVAMATLLFRVEATGAAVVVVLFAVAFAAYAVFRREMIWKAGHIMETAAKGLGKNPGIFGVLLPVEVIYVGYMFFWVNGWAQSTKIVGVHYDETDNFCELTSGSTGMMWLVTLLLMWFSFYIDHVKVTVVSATLAHWAFGQGAAGRATFSLTMPLRALRWSVWESSPTLAVSSLVCTVVERVKRTLQNKCNWVNPICCCVMVIGMVCFSFLQAFGRFTVVVHAITGRPFYTSAAHAYRLLVKGGNLEHALSADFFIGLSLSLFAYVLSLGLGVAMWAWVDDAENLGSMDVSGSWQGWFWALFIVFCILNRYPYFSIFIVILLGKWQWLANTTDGKSSAILLGMFTAGICHVIFAFFAGIVLDGVDAMVICYAIDKQNGLLNSDNKDVIVSEMYVILDDMAKKEAEAGFVDGDEGAASNLPMASATATPVSGNQTLVPVAPQTIQLQVPEGVSAGQQVQVVAPDGRQLMVTVPAGMGPGSQIVVQVPSV